MNNCNNAKAREKFSFHSVNAGNEQTQTYFEKFLLVQGSFKISYHSWKLKVPPERIFIMVDADLGYGCEQKFGCLSWIPVCVLVPLILFHWGQHSNSFLTFNFYSQLLWIWFQLCNYCHLTLKEKPHMFSSSAISLEACMGILLASKCWEHPAHVRLRDKSVSKDTFICPSTLIT